MVEWRQFQEYASVTDFVWLRRMDLVLDNPKKEAGTETTLQALPSWYP